MSLSPSLSLSFSLSLSLSLSLSPSLSLSFSLSLSLSPSLSLSFPLSLSSSLSSSLSPSISFPPYSFLSLSIPRPSATNLPLTFGKVRTWARSFPRCSSTCTTSPPRSGKSLSARLFVSFLSLPHRKLILYPSIFVSFVFNSVFGKL